MAGFWGRRKRESEQQQAQDAELSKTAQAALIAADERIRTTGDELAFAEIELGTAATDELRAALDAVRTHLAEAFHLHQLNHDDIPDTPEELRTRNARIAQLCEWAEELLDDRTEALAEPIARARRAPEIIDGIRRDIAATREQLPHLSATIERVSARYAPDAIRKVAGNPDEIAQLLDFAEHGADVTLRRRESGQREQANLALETAIEANRRARTLVEAVESFEIEALRAETTLAAIIDDSRGDLVDARAFAGTPAVATAITALEEALRSSTPAGRKADPFTELSRLRAANTALDVAVDAARERASRPQVSEAHLRHAIEDADEQLSIARSVISGHRGWIGADARTRLAEAERVHRELPTGPVADDDRAHVQQRARRSAALASEALQLAQRDIDASRPGAMQPHAGGYGYGGGRRGGFGGDMASGILGGLVIGSILDGIFD